MIFEEQISRKPDHYPWAQEFIEAMHNGFWTDKEFSFSSDIQDFNVNLNPKERDMIIRTLSAIGQIEVAVKKFWSKLGDNLPHPALTDLGYVMANVEVIHNNAYERLLKVLGLEDVFEKNLKLDFIEGRAALSNLKRAYPYPSGGNNKDTIPQAYSSCHEVINSNIQLMSNDAAPSVIKNELDASI